MSEWISVKDRLPELPDDPTILNNSVRVLATNGESVRERVWCKPIFNKRNREPRWEEPGGRLSYSRVTHWMPLPEPPKEQP